MDRNSTNPHLSPDVLTTSLFAHVSEQHPIGASGDSGFTPVVSLRRYTRSTRAHVDPDHLNIMAASIHQVPLPAPTAFEALSYNDNDDNATFDYYDFASTSSIGYLPCCGVATLPLPPVNDASNLNSLFNATIIAKMRAGANWAVLPQGHAIAIAAHAFVPRTSPLRNRAATEPPRTGLSTPRHRPPPPVY